LTIFPVSIRRWDGGTAPAGKMPLTRFFPSPGGQLYRLRSAADSVRFFPLVGILLGLFFALADYGLGRIFSPVLTAALILALNALITGGLHLDGFADACDGLLSRRNREQTLAIMRDTGIGALGAAALFILLIVKLAVLIEIAEPLRLQALLLFPFMGRLSMAGAVCWFPYARTEAGMGRAYARADEHDLTFARRMGLMIVITTFLYFRATPREVILILTAIFISFCGSYFFAHRVALKLGGLTGDVYGAINEVTELLFLLVVAAGAQLV